MTSKPISKRSEQIMNVLIAAGYKLTKPRMEVVSCLLDGQHAHTAEEIGRHLSALSANKSVNMRTVYSVLSLLKGLNLVHEYFIDGKHRFELTAGSEDHIHLINDDERSLLTVRIDEQLRAALDTVAARAGCQIKDVQISMHVAKQGKK